jgi:hypothetical protein
MDRSHFRLARHWTLRGRLRALARSACARATATLIVKRPPARRRCADRSTAICLDTSGSMDGLIDAARQKIWSIVNDLALATPTPRCASRTTPATTATTPSAAGAVTRLHGIRHRLGAALRSRPTEAGLVARPDAASRLACRRRRTPSLIVVPATVGGAGPKARLQERLQEPRVEPAS